jgi:hypothetical protein
MHHQDNSEIFFRNLEQIDSANELARTLREFDLTPNGEPRIEALFRRAIRGNGPDSQLLGSIHGELA